jgi:hypothetical protein
MIAALALLAALQADPDAAGCRPDEVRAAANGAEIRTLGHANGVAVVLAGPQASCLCGNVNCPWYVLRLSGTPPAVLLKTFGYAADVVAESGALPALRVTAHDSALISVQTDYVGRDGAYVESASWMVRGDTGERKRFGIPVHFAPGTSAAALHGNVSLDWGDTYALRASRGQHLTVENVRVPAGSGVAFYLTAPDRNHTQTLAPGVAATLPVAGAYTLLVDVDRNEATPYAFTLTIR